jgi:hypothetical protein
MKTPFWKTYVALAVLAGAGAYYFAVAHKHTPAAPGTSAKPREKVFKGLERDKIEELILNPASGDPIQLVKQDGAWRMTAPQAMPAATSEVASILDSLVGLESEATATEAPSNLADFGLAPARMTVGIKVAGASEPLRLAIGDDVPGMSQLFAKRTSESRVFTVASYLRGTLEKKPFDLRDRDLLHLQRAAVKSIAVTGHEGSYSLTRGERDTWSFSQPLQTAADRWSVDRLLGSLESLRMETVAADPAKNLKAFGLDRPQRVVSLGLNDGQRKVLELGAAAPEGKYYAREADATLVAVIPARLVDDLKKGIADLRAKRLLEVSAYDVESFEIETGGAKKAYQRSTTKDKEGIDVYKWKRTAPDAKDLDTNHAQDALFKIAAVEASGFVDAPQALATYGLDQPALKVTLKIAASAAGPASSSWLELGQKAGVYYARRPDDAAILRVDSAKAEDLIKALTGL